MKVLLDKSDLLKTISTLGGPTGPFLRALDGLELKSSQCICTVYAKWSLFYEGYRVDMKPIKRPWWLRKCKVPPFYMAIQDIRDDLTTIFGEVEHFNKKSTDYSTTAIFKTNYGYVKVTMVKWDTQ